MFIYKKVTERSRGAPAMAKGRYVSYLRVSTDRQGRSGLGLEAQRKAVEDFLNGGRWDLIAEFVEVESGKRDDRPKLAEALGLCRLHNATLVIAKLDRLSRDAAFLLGLQKAGVRFVAADMPEANELVVGIMAVVAQAERKMISTRTKAALAAAKARGARLGKPENLRNQDTGRMQGRAKRSAVAAARAADLRDPHGCAGLGCIIASEDMHMRTIFIIRHAEKPPDGPHLSERGYERAR